MNFARRGTRLRLLRLRVPARLVAVVIGLAVFTVLWRLVPVNALFWVLLPVVGVLVWMASYAWRRALQAVRALVDWLERLGE
jgi:hypothetical protein